MVFELLFESSLLFRIEFWFSAFAGAGVEVALFSSELEVAPDGAGVDVVASGYFVGGLSLVDGGDDSLSEVRGVGFDALAYSTGNSTERRFKTGHRTRQSSHPAARRRAAHNRSVAGSSPAGPTKEAPSGTKKLGLLWLPEVPANSAITAITANAK